MCISDKERELLKSAAKNNIQNAHAFYSNFPVSASVITKSGKVFTGVNIENSTYNLGICAERVAIFKAVSEGYLDLEAIAIYSPSNQLVTPCGSCRQIIYEFINSGKVISFNEHKSIEENISDLLPRAFSDKNLGNR